MSIAYQSLVGDNLNESIYHLLHRYIMVVVGEGGYFLSMFCEGRSFWMSKHGLWILLHNIVFHQLTY